MAEPIIVERSKVDIAIGKFSDVSKIHRDLSFAYRAAESNLNRAKRAGTESIGMQEAFLGAKRKLDEVQAEYDSAKEQLKKTERSDKEMELLFGSSLKLMQSNHVRKYRKLPDADVLKIAKVINTEEWRRKKVQAQSIQFIEAAAEKGLKTHGYPTRFIPKSDREDDTSDYSLED